MIPQVKVFYKELSRNTLIHIQTKKMLHFQPTLRHE